MPREDESSELAESFRDRKDKQAAEKLYDLNWRRVRRYARTVANLWNAPRYPVKTDYSKPAKRKKPITRDEDRLSEICSEVWLAVVTGIKQFKRQKGSFRSWIWGITRNKAIDDIEKFTKQPPPVSLDEEPVDQTDDDPKKRAELRIDVMNALGSLEPAERRVILLRYFENKKIARIAKTMRLSNGQVQDLFQSGYRKLRPLLKEWAPPPEKKKPQTP
jgi:RNA polymerase sigma-70 factor (ECF subfamily)